MGTDSGTGRDEGSNEVVARAREYRDKRGHWGSHAEALCAEIDRLQAVLHEIGNGWPKSAALLAEIARHALTERDALHRQLREQAATPECPDCAESEAEAQRANVMQDSITRLLLRTWQELSDEHMFTRAEVREHLRLSLQEKVKGSASVPEDRLTPGDCEELRSTQTQEGQQK